MGKNDIISIDKVEYQKWIQNLCDEIDRQRLKAVMQLNASTLQHYWWLGNDILKKQEAQGWGAKVINMLSADLMMRYGSDSGYSIRNLKYMRQFAVEYPDFPFVQVPLAQLQNNQVLKSRLSNFTVSADGLLCRSKNNTKVEYALRGMTQPLGVAAYKTKELIENLKSSLPSIDDLEKKLND